MKIRIDTTKGTVLKADKNGEYKPWVPTMEELEKIEKTIHDHTECSLSGKKEPR